MIARRLIWQLLLVAVLLFITELAVMYILPALGLNGVWAYVADGLMLATFALGPLYFLGFRTYSLPERHDAHTSPQRLYRYHILVSIIAVATILLLAGFSSRSAHRAYVITEAERSAGEIATALRDSAVTDLFRPRSSEGPDASPAPGVPAQLDRDLRAFLGPFNIVKIKVFDDRRRIVYSTDRQIIGQLNYDNPMLEDALSGLTVSKLETKESVRDLANEQRLDVDVVETYVPILGTRGGVLGSFEIYREVTRELAEARTSWTRSTGVLFVVLLGVFAGLSAIMHRTARILRAGDIALEQSRDEMREHNEMLIEGLEREKRLAGQLEMEREKAEAANRTKSEFLANVSHEIRTPMTAILGYNETLLDPRLSAPERLNAIHAVHRNGEHLLQIINDILDLSKVEAGKLEVEHIRCSPARIVADVHSLMRARAGAKNLRLNIEYAGPIPETIESDPTRLRQILVNLVGNAIRFTSTGDVRIVVRLVNADQTSRAKDGEPAVCGAPPCPVTCNPESTALQFDVIDTGTGITPQQVDRLFEPFVQADASTTRKFGGTGLGLAISKRLAHALGGTLTVDSRPAEGSTFRLEIPTGPLAGITMLDNPALTQVPDRYEDATVEDDAKTSIPGCSVLLVEDTKDNQLLISHILRKAGAEVTVRQNGKLAVDAALAARDEGRPFDVILMDMQMPVMDGYEATALLRRRGYSGPIIALTAHAMEGDRKRCLDAGCDDYASKPVNRKKLIETVAGHLRREPAGAAT